MNAVRPFTGLLVFVVGIAGLCAQNPVLQLERRDPADGAAWAARTTLLFRVTLLHPAARKGGGDGDFVLDPPGGWRSAIRLVVTDAAGKTVDWPFENRGKDITQPLQLHRLGTASVSFLLDPSAKGTAIPPGRYQVRARLSATTGKWRGSVESPPLAVECVERAQPELQMTGLAAGPMLRGWPVLLGVQVTAPDGRDGGLSLPTEEKNGGQVISLTLLDRADRPVGLPMERLPVAERPQVALSARESRTFWFRVAADATRALGEGPYRWQATFTLPAARSPADQRWSGRAVLTTAPFSVAAAPATLTGEQARRHTWSQVEDFLVEAKLLRASAEGGYLNDRTLAAQQAAVPLHRAEKLALQWHDAHPDEPDGAMLVANVMAAQEDKDRAILYARRAIAADQRQRAPSSGDSADAGRALSLLVRGFEAMPDERHAVLTPALRTALKDVRAGKLAPTPTPASRPATSVAAPAATAVVAPAPAPTAAVVPVAPSGQVLALLPANPTRAGVPSPGKVVPRTELVEASILADAAGQWAAAARAGSEYGRTQYSAARATGAPNVPVAGNSPDAWCPAVRNVGLDWLAVTFARPVSAVEVRVRQSDASGALAKVEAIEPDGTSHLWWEGVDPAKAAAIREIVWFAVRVPATAYPVAHVKLTLNLASGPGYKQIDAVQLVAAP